MEYITMDSARNPVAIIQIFNVSGNLIPSSAQSVSGKIH